MPTRTEVKVALNEYLGQPSHFAMVLSGRWGSGKTHLWKEVAGSLKDQVITVSCFGAESVSEIRRRILTAALKRATSLEADQAGKAAVVGIWESFLPALSGFLEKQTGISLGSKEIDPLSFLPEGLVVCIDDFERVGTSVETRSVLGLANQLVEQRSCKVILIMDDAELEGKNKEFVRFKERVVRVHVRLDADVTTMAQALVSTDLAECFDVEGDALSAELVDVFSVAGDQNLRTLIRVVDLLKHIGRHCEEGQLHLDLARFCAILCIQQANGKLQDVGFYTFSSLHLAFSSKEDPTADEQRTFQKKFYSDRPQYRFFRCVYTLVNDGVLNLHLLKAETNPEFSDLSQFEKLISEAAADEFGFKRAEDYIGFLERVEKALIDGKGATVEHVFGLMTHADFAAHLSGDPMPTTILDAAQNRVTQLVRVAEELPDVERFRRSRQSSVVAALLDHLKVIVGQEQVRKLGLTLRDLLKARGTTEMLRFLRHQPDRAYHLVVEDPLLLPTVFSADADEFTLLVFGALVELAQSLQSEREEKYVGRLVPQLLVASSSVADPSAKVRMNGLVERLPKGWLSKPAVQHELAHPKQS